MKAWQYFMAGAATGVALTAAFVWHRGTGAVVPADMPSETETVRIVVRRDTVVIRQPEVMVVHHRDTVTDTLPMVADSAVSVPVAIPVEQRCYSGEGYRAWVSGYRPRLDSIAVERATPAAIVSSTRRRPSRWSVAVSAGVGVTATGSVGPYVGIGISYSIISF